MKIQFNDLKLQYLELQDSINQRIQSVLEHGQYIMGPEVSELEAALSSYVGVKDCVTVGSGTDALLISLLALGVKPGDEVITTPFTFVSTAEVIALLKATPVFVDVEPDTCNIDVSLVEEAITERTKAIICVSLYGQIADIDELNDIAKKHGNIPIIEDAAQSFGAIYRGKKSCALTTIGCTSFFPSKPLGCYGDGGALFTDDPDLAEKARRIRVHGQERRYHHVDIGIGGRMDTIQCAVVLAKFEVFDWELRKRQEYGRYYCNKLSEIEGVTPLTVKSDRDCVWGQFTVFVDRRDLIIPALRNHGVPTAVHYPTPLHHQPAYANLARNEGQLTNAETVAKKVMSLPMHARLDASTIDSIVDALKESVL